MLRPPTEKKNDETPLQAETVEKLGGKVTYFRGSGWESKMEYDGVTMTIRGAGFIKDPTIGTDENGQRWTLWEKTEIDRRKEIRKREPAIVPSSHSA